MYGSDPARLFRHCCTPILGARRVLRSSESVPYSLAGSRLYFCRNFTSVGFPLPRSATHNPRPAIHRPRSDNHKLIHDHYKALTTKGIPSAELVQQNK